MTHPTRRWYARMFWLCTCVAAFVLSSFAAGSAFADDTCSARKKPANVLLLIDRSAKFDDLAASNLRAGALRLFNSLCDGDTLTVHSIVDELVESKLLFKGTIPECKGMFSSCNAHAEKLKRRNLRDGRFVAMLDAVVNETKERPRSPIAETVFEAVGSQQRFEDVFVSTDGFQNSDGCKFVQGKDVLCDWGLAFDEKTLAGARVTLFGIGRSDAAARKPISSRDLSRMRQFWATTLKSAGAREVNVRINLSAADVAR